MDDLLNKPAPQPQPQPGAPKDLTIAEQVEAVRQLAIWGMVAMLVIAGAFDLFLLRQYKNENAELAGAHANVDQFMADWQKYQQPAIENFFAELAKYGQTHPDIGPILEKYRLQPQAGTGPGQGAHPNAPSPMTLPTGATSGGPPPNSSSTAPANLPKKQ